MKYLLVLMTLMFGFSSIGLAAAQQSLSTNNVESVGSNILLQDLQARY